MPVITERDHALHNEEAAHFLNSANIYCDWVEIVAFYSALHFVRGKIFPLDEEKNGRKISYTNFDAYCSFNSPENMGKSKHQVLIGLAYQKLPAIAPQYEQLYHLSITARYNDYKIPKSVSDKAIDKLAEIKTVCIKT